MKERVSILRKHWLFFLIVVAAVTGGSYAIFSTLSFPPKIVQIFSGILGLEALLISILGVGVKARIMERISNVRYQNKSLGIQIFLSLFFFALGLGIYLLYPPVHVWVRTLLLSSMGVLFLYGVSTLLISIFLQAEMNGTLGDGFTERWSGRLVASSIIIVGLTFLLMFNFLGGIYWWYQNYVTPEKRAKVLARGKELRSIQLTTLYDRQQKYLGLYTKRESDWNRYYNDPQLLKWKVSKSIALAEGVIKKPAWWWKYLPDGESLRCEPFSIEAFLRVPYYFIKQRRKVGGSTPALQAAKNFLDFGASRETGNIFSRVSQKLFEEMPRSYIMCQFFTPRDMMSVYMATLWSGQGANYGLHRMSLYYFGIDEPYALDWNQSAVLAASLPNAGSFNPWYLESCLKGKCKSKRRTRVFKVWLQRINQIKAHIRRAGHKVPKELPPFRNGMDKLHAISKDWKVHDIHIRKWIERELQEKAKNWKNGAQVKIYYDRELTLGRPPSKKKEAKKGLIDIADQFVLPFRESLDDIQLAFTLVDANTGQIFSQYGGDTFVDMATAKKPVVGSTFKVMTLLSVGEHWPDNMYILNKGSKSSHYRRFKMHGRAHTVRNSHAMPSYLNKVDALTISANVGFVFISLRWTWFLSQTKWKQVLKNGLEQMYIERRKLTQEQATKKAAELLKDPKELRRQLIRHFGFGRVLRGLRKKAIFEAAKAATIKERLADSSANKKELAVLLGTDPAGYLSGFSQDMKNTFDKHKARYQQRFSGELTFEEISWLKDLRMDMGLRHIIKMAKTVGNFNPRKEGLRPVITMTLGVNNASTVQLANIASFVASGKLKRATLVKVVRRGPMVQYRPSLKTKKIMIPKRSLQKVRNAMNSVLRKGTAKRAGKWLAKERGEKILAISGAKTGTVQNSKGVSCIGYIGSVAGAVTLSTPKNDVLRTYRVRSIYKKRLDSYVRQEQRWSEIAQKSKQGSRAQKRALKRQKRYQKKIEKYQKMIREYRELGKNYHSSRKTWKKMRKQASRLYRSASRAYARSKRERRRANLYQARARKYLRLQKRYKNRLIKLEASGKENVKETRKYELYQQRHERYKEQQEDYTRMYLKARKRQKTYLGKRKALLEKRKALLKESLVHRQKYRSLSKVFYKTHQPWSISSSKACTVLFALLNGCKAWHRQARLAASISFIESSPVILNPTIRSSAQPKEKTTGIERIVTDAGDIIQIEPLEKPRFFPSNSNGGLMVLPKTSIHHQKSSNNKTNPFKTAGSKSNKPNSQQQTAPSEPRLIPLKKFKPKKPPAKRKPMIFLAPMKPKSLQLRPLGPQAKPLRPKLDLLQELLRSKKKQKDGK